MKASELDQIGIAIFNSGKWNIAGMGSIVTMDAVFAILNSHCADGKIQIETVKPGSVEYRFSTPRPPMFKIVSCTEMQIQPFESPVFKLQFSRLVDGEWVDGETLVANKDQVEWFREISKNG